MAQQALDGGCAHEPGLGYGFAEGAHRHALAHATGGDGQLVGAKVAHHLVEDDGAADDGVGATGADAVDLAALNQAVSREEGAHLAHRLSVHGIAVQAGDGVGALSLGETREGACASAGGDELLAGVQSGWSAAGEGLGDHAPHGLELFARGWVVREPGGAGAERAEREAPGADDRAGDDAGDLGTAAADIDNNAGANGEPVESAGGGELRLLGAVQHFDGETQLGVCAGKQLVAVAGRADGGGGDDVDGDGAGLARQGGELGDRVDGGGDATLAQLGALVELGGEAQVEALLGDGFEHAGDGVVNHHDSGRVRAKVDDCYRFTGERGSRGSAVEDGDGRRTSWENSHRRKGTGLVSWKC